MSLECARELQVLALDKGYQIWEALAKVIEGVSLAGAGRVEEGLRLSESGVGLYQGLTTPPVFWPLILSLRSFAHLSAGKHEEAHSLIDDAIDMMGGDQSIYPEFLVLKGDIIRSDPRCQVDQAVTAYRGAIAGALRLQLRGIELHALTHLVSVLAEQGDGADERKRLAAVYESIEGGEGELEMVAAGRLLRSS